MEFFIAVLGCSQLTYAQAVASQRTEDFTEALQNAIRYFGGVPAAIVPDNLKADVIRANRYEPQINETLSDFTLHYETAILPARSGKPRDKALMEGAVNTLHNRVYAALRNRVFHRLDELNLAILKRVHGHNQMLFSGKEYSRRSRFVAYEQAQLTILPTSL